MRYWFFALLFFSQPLFAEIKWFHCNPPSLGEYELGRDFYFCANLSTRSGLFSDFRFLERLALHRSEGYLGGHFRKHAFHFRPVYFRGIHYPKAGKIPPLLVNLAEIETFSYQYGLFGQDPLVFNLGRSSPQFGLDPYHPSVLLYYLTEKQFWPGPSYGVQVTYDDRRFAQITGSYHLDSRRTSKDEKPVELLAYRTMFDFDTLDGTRLVFSYLGRAKGGRDYSAAFLNVRPNESMFFLEWRRHIEDLDFQKSYREQMFRIGYEAPAKNNEFFKMIYQDEASVARTLVMMQNYRHNPYLLSTAELIFRKEERKKGKIRWYWGYSLAAQI